MIKLKEFDRRPDLHGPTNDNAILPAPAARKTLLLIESCPLLGEIFSHALKEAAHDLDVRIRSDLQEIDMQASLVVLNFMQRSSDPLLVGFVIRQLRARLGNLPLLIITDSADPAIGKVMEEAGVRNWITATMGFGEAITAIRQAMSLAACLEARAASAEGRPGPSSAAPAPAASEHKWRTEIRLGLTEREIDVLSLLKKGKQNKVIAYALNISESTTKVHIRNIMRKFHLRNRTEVALMCGASMQPPAAPVLTEPGLEGGLSPLPTIAS